VTISSPRFERYKVPQKEYRKMTPTSFKTLLDKLEFPESPEARNAALCSVFGWSRTTAYRMLTRGGAPRAEAMLLLLARDEGWTLIEIEAFVDRHKTTLAS
jgi:predicted DNA-binding transcriptional regulator AlpA